MRYFLCHMNWHSWNGGGPWEKVTKALEVPSQEAALTAWRINHPGDKVPFTYFAIEATDDLSRNRVLAASQQLGFSKLAPVHEEFLIYLKRSIDERSRSTSDVEAIS